MPTSLLTSPYINGSREVAICWLLLPYVARSETQLPWEVAGSIREVHPHDGVVSNEPCDNGAGV